MGTVVVDQPGIGGKHDIAAELVEKLFVDEDPEAPLFGLLQTIAGVDHSSIELLLTPFLLPE